MPAYLGINLIYLDGICTLTNRLGLSHLLAHLLLYWINEVTVSWNSFIFSTINFWILGKEALPFRECIFEMCKQFGVLGSFVDTFWNLFSLKENSKIQVLGLKWAKFKPEQI